MKETLMFDKLMKYEKLYNDFREEIKEKYNNPCDLKVFIARINDLIEEMKEKISLMDGEAIEFFVWYSRKDFKKLEDGDEIHDVDYYQNDSDFFEFWYKITLGLLITSEARKRLIIERKEKC